MVELKLDNSGELNDECVKLENGAGNEKVTVFESNLDSRVQFK
jgi:hypothetical protein